MEMVAPPSPVAKGGYPQWRIVSRNVTVLGSHPKASSSTSVGKELRRKFSWNIGTKVSASATESQHQVDVISSLTTHRVRVFVSGNLVEDIARAAGKKGALPPFQAHVRLGQYRATIVTKAKQDAHEEEFDINLPECAKATTSLEAQRTFEQNTPPSSPSLSSSSDSISPAARARESFSRAFMSRPQAVPRYPLWTVVTPVETSPSQSWAQDPDVVWDAWHVQLAREDNQRIYADVKVMWNTKTDKLAVYVGQRLAVDCLRGQQDRFPICIDEYEAAIIACENFELIVIENTEFLPQSPLNRKEISEASGGSFLQSVPSVETPLVVPVESARPVGRGDKESKLRYTWRVLVVRNGKQESHRVIVTWEVQPNILRIFIDGIEKTAGALVIDGSISTPGCTVSGFTVHILHSGAKRLQIALLPQDRGAECISGSTCKQPLSPASLSTLFRTSQIQNGETPEGCDPIGTDGDDERIGSSKTKPGQRLVTSENEASKRTPIRAREVNQKANFQNAALSSQVALGFGSEARPRSVTPENESRRFETREGIAGAERFETPDEIATSSGIRHEDVHFVTGKTSSSPDRSGHRPAMQRTIDTDMGQSPLLSMSEDASALGTIWDAGSGGSLLHPLARGSSFVESEKKPLGVGRIFRGSKLKYLWRVTTVDEFRNSSVSRVTLTWSKRSHKIRIFDGTHLIAEYAHKAADEFNAEVLIGGSMCHVFSPKGRDEFELLVGSDATVMRGMDSTSSLGPLTSPSNSLESSSFCDDESTAFTDGSRPRCASVVPEFSKVGVGKVRKASKLKYGWRLHLIDSDGNDGHYLLVLTWSKASGRVRVMVEDRVLLDRSWAATAPFNASIPIGNNDVVIEGTEDDEFSLRLVEHVAP